MYSEKPINMFSCLRNPRMPYCDREEAPFRSFHGQAFTPRWPFQRSDSLCSNVYVCLCLSYISEFAQAPLALDMMFIPRLSRRLLSLPDASTSASFALRSERVVSGICLRWRRMRIYCSPTRLPWEAHTSQRDSISSFWSTHTRFVPLCKAQIDWSTVNLSPNL